MRMAIGVAALLLAGCVTNANDQVASVPPGTCVRDTGAHLVGQSVDRVGRAEIMRVTGAVTVRIVHPGEAVTMDYREDRVTVTVDDKDVIERVSCG